MIVVTGGAGFIGSNLVRTLAEAGSRVLVVDDLGNASKFRNLRGCRIAGYLDKTEFRRRLRNADPSLSGIEAVFHQGACTDTLERNVAFLDDNNLRYSTEVLEWCDERRVPLVYASSAAVYGLNHDCREVPECEQPLNAYGNSKLEFDRVVRERQDRFRAPVAGLRYFNVYGPGEAHKGRMASVVYHFSRQAAATGRVKLFRGNDGYADGGQQRDFIHVRDVVKINLWFLEHAVSGIFNVGTGNARSFNEVAAEVLRWHGGGEIEYIDFPAALVGQYQSYTRADPAALRAVGCAIPFTTLETGVRDYLDQLHAAPNMRASQRPGAVRGG